jgi:hypothetical protein
MTCEPVWEHGLIHSGVLAQPEMGIFGSNVNELDMYIEFHRVRKTEQYLVLSSDPTQ